MSRNTLPLADIAAGWVAHEAGPCPVHPSVIVEIVCRCGLQNGAWRAGMWSEGVSDWWAHDGKGMFGHLNDIVAYRVVQS